jgi:hypothetical protein
MALEAPDTNPDVEPTPVPAQGSVWAVIGSFVGLLVALLPVLPLPDSVKPWMPAITAFLGWALHQLVGDDEYRPKKS